MNNYNELLSQKCEKSLTSFKNELVTIRATGAHPNLISHLMVNYYDTLTPITQLSNIKSFDATQLIIIPFDRTMNKEIIKVIVKSNLGFNPIDEGNQIRIPVPPLTGENRLIFIKDAKELSEKAKISLRNVRHEIMKKIDQDESLSKNEIELEKNAIQKTMDHYNKLIDELTKQKQIQLEKI